MQRWSTWCTLGLVVVIATGCAARSAPYHRMDEVVYTQTNLHPDEPSGKLTSANYQMDGLIPRCTRVVFIEQTRKGVHFTVEDTGRTYWYLRHRTLREPFATNLDRYFGAACDAAEVAQMSDVDRKGILEGKAYPGMSKRAVVFALGFPPEHATPSTDADAWRYWRNRWRTFIVHFENGVVTRVQG